MTKYSWSCLYSTKKSRPNVICCLEKQPPPICTNQVLLSSWCYVVGTIHSLNQLNWRVLYGVGLVDLAWIAPAGALRRMAWQAKRDFVNAISGCWPATAARHCCYCCWNKHAWKKKETEMNLWGTRALSFLPLFRHFLSLRHVSYFVKPLIKQSYSSLEYLLTYFILEFLLPNEKRLRSWAEGAVMLLLADVETRWFTIIALAF